MQTRLGNSHKNSDHLKSHAVEDTLLSPSERRPDTFTVSPQSQNHGSPKRVLDAKFIARKTVSKPKPTQPSSNLAAATEAEIVVASSPEPAVENEEKNQDEEPTGPPRKKTRTSPTRTEPSLRPTLGSARNEKGHFPTTLPPKPSPLESSRADDRRRIGENKNFNLRAQTENPSPPANGSVGRGNVYDNTRAKDFPIRDVFKTQTRGDAESVNAPKQVQRILAAPVPTLGRPSPPSVLASSKTPNPPPLPGAGTARVDANQTASRAAHNPSIVAPQPQARNQNHALNREISFGQGQQKTAVQSQNSLFDNLFHRQDSHSQAPKSSKNSPRPSPLPSDTGNFSAFGLHPNLNGRKTSLGRSESPNSGLLRPLQDSKSRSQQPARSAQINNAQGSNAQSSGVSHATKVPEPTPSSNTQNTAANFGFDLKMPGRGFLIFGDASRGNQPSASQQPFQSAQTAAQRALNYSTTFATNGDVSNRASPPSPPLPPAAMAPASTGPRAPVATMNEGQTGDRSCPINLDTSSDEEELFGRPMGYVRPTPPQPCATEEIQKIQQTRQTQRPQHKQKEKQKITNPTVANSVSTKPTVNGAPAAAVSVPKPSGPDRPSVDHQKPATAPEAAASVPGDETSFPSKLLLGQQRPAPAPEVTTNGIGKKPSVMARPSIDHRQSDLNPTPAPDPETVANGCNGRVLDTDSPLMPFRKAGAVPNLAENVSGGKSSDSDRPLMDRWRAKAAANATAKPSDDKGSGANRTLLGPIGSSEVAAARAQPQARVLNGSDAAKTYGDQRSEAYRSFTNTAFRGQTGAATQAQTMAQILGKVKSTAAIALEAEFASFGDEALESDRPLLILDQRWKNITPREWQQLTPVERSTALVDRHDANEFDSAIYSKANESSNPNSGFYGVPSYALRVTAPPRPEPKFLAHINPWTHWTHARTPEWHAEKQEEIKARGNRKDPRNFGQAAKRVAEGKATRGHLPSYRKPELPDRVKTNPSWMAALAELNKLKEAYHAEQRTKTQQRKRRRKGKDTATQHRNVDGDGDVDMDDSSGSVGNEPVRTSQRPTEFALHRGNWTVIR